MNLNRTIKELKEKHYENKLTNADISNLIFYCEVLLIRNNEIGMQLREALNNVEKLKQRVDFYRSITLPKTLR